MLERLITLIARKRSLFLMTCDIVALQKRSFFRSVIARVASEIFLSMQLHVDFQTTLVHQPFGTLRTLEESLFSRLVNSVHMFLQSGSSGKIVRTNFAYVWDLGDRRR